LADASPITATQRNRTEPTANTIADLVALIVGVGLAISFEWHSAWAVPLGMGGRGAPRWFGVLRYVDEGLQNGLMAMIVVVIARRLRYGGPIRPAEFLAFTVGVPRLLLGLQRLPALGLITRVPGTELRSLDIEWFRLWMLAESTLCALALATALAFRRRLAPWVVCCLLSGAWVAQQPVEFFTQEVRDAILLRYHPPIWAVRLLNDLLAMPFVMLAVVPIVAVLFYELRGNRPARTWVETACLGLGLASFVAVEIRICSWFYLGPGWSNPVEQIVVRMAELAFGAIMCVLLVKRYGARFASWLGLAGPQHLEAPARQR
jgi:hypothetical protein